MTLHLKTPSADLSVNDDFFDLLTGNFARLVGKPLVGNAQGTHWLYNDAPFAVLTHNTEPDPRFIYANQAAQACFEYAWDEFITSPSRLSAEAPNRAERQRLMETVARTGFISDYRGVRISKSGRRFGSKTVSSGNSSIRPAIRAGRPRRFPRGPTCKQVMVLPLAR